MVQDIILASLFPYFSLYVLQRSSGRIHESMAISRNLSVENENFTTKTRKEKFCISGASCIHVSTRQIVLVWGIRLVPLNFVYTDLMWSLSFNFSSNPEMLKCFLTGEFVGKGSSKLILILNRIRLCIPII